MQKTSGKDLFHRTELLVGPENMEKISSAKIILFGVGGVGSWCAEALIRTGFTHLTIVDSDLICPTNVNRQLQATSINVGKPKVEELRGRLLQINPEADIKAFKMFYDKDTAAAFTLSDYDYILDAIDSLTSKVMLIKNALDAGVKIFSSMGAASKFDPTQIRTAPISKTKHCPLARMVRKRLGQLDVKASFTCVYSEEFPTENKGNTFCGSTVCACPDKDGKNICAMKSQINGSLVHITAPFGFALAGLVIQDIVPREEDILHFPKGKNN